MAESLGLPFEDMGGETIRRFILFHEAGHAHDFLTNFLGEQSSVSMEDAVSMWGVNSRDQLDSLPLPGRSPAALRAEISLAGGFEAWERLHQDLAARVSELGTSSEEELFSLQEAAYRQLDKEDYADRFAAKAFQRFRNQTVSVSEL